MELTIQRALNELKIIDSRIEKKLTQLTVIGTKKNSETKVSETYDTIQDFSVKANACLDSVDDLIKRKNKLKHAVMESNAKTSIEVAGVTYSVMTAIERKNSIQTEKNLLVYLNRALKSATLKLERENMKVEEYVQRQTLTMVGGDVSNKKEDFVTKFEQEYIDKNSWTLVDPLSLEELISKREKEIEDFELEIDTILTESNAITKIVIED